MEQVCKPKNEGGTRIRPSKVHNQALTMKVLWGMIKEPNAQWVKLFKGKYCKILDLFTISVSPARKSYLWRWLLKVLPEFRKGISWSPQNGAQVLFWKHAWLMDQALEELIDAIPTEHSNKRVNEYVTNTGEWDWATLETLLPQEFLLHLAATKIDISIEESDAIIWNRTSLGTFSTESAYRMLAPESDV